MLPGVELSLPPSLPGCTPWSAEGPLWSWTTPPQLFHLPHLHSHSHGSITPSPNAWSPVRFDSTLSTCYGHTVRFCELGGQSASTGTEGWNPMCFSSQPRPEWADDSLEMGLACLRNSWPGWRRGWSPCRMPVSPQGATLPLSIPGLGGRWSL